MVLQNNITTLTAENHNLTSLNEELKEQSKNLTEIIKNSEENRNELNVSRAQWSIDEYCPKTNNGKLYFRQTVCAELHYHVLKIIMILCKHLLMEYFYLREKLHFLPEWLELQPFQLLCIC